MATGQVKARRKSKNKARALCIKHEKNGQVWHEIVEIVLNAEIYPDYVNRWITVKGHYLAEVSATIASAIDLWNRC